MMHDKRRFHIKRTNGPMSLACALTFGTKTLCSGFELELNGKRMLFLNDSFTEDSLQEYAVVIDGRQVETLTVSWMNPLLLAKAFHAFSLAIGHHDYGSCTPTLDYEDHTCELCR
jgi:hypothetical protein